MRRPNCEREEGVIGRLPAIDSGVPDSGMSRVAVAELRSVRCVTGLTPDAAPHSGRAACRPGRACSAWAFDIFKYSALASMRLA